MKIRSLETIEREEEQEAREASLKENIKGSTADLAAQAAAGQVEALLFITITRDESDELEINVAGFGPGISDPRIETLETCAGGIARALRDIVKTPAGHKED